MRKPLPANYGGVQTFWTDLLALEAAAGAGSQLSTSVGTTPFHTPILLQWIKILKTRKRVLRQGQSCSFNLLWKKPFTMWGYDVDDAWITQPKQFVGWLIITTGQPTNDTAQTGTGTANIAYDFVSTRNYKWNVAPGYQTETNYVTSGFTAVAQSKMVNIGSGAVADALLAANIA